MDDKFEENLKKGRLLIERLEELQYSYFNYRPKWITIHKDKLKLFMAYIYYGHPSHNKIDENGDIDIDNTKKIFGLYKEKEKEEILKLNKNLEKFIEPDCHNRIQVGVTMTHSICKNKCDTCQNFPSKDIHKWILLRLKSIKTKFYVIDFEHNKIYHSWKEYIEKNDLLEGYMFYPNSGFYDASSTLHQNITPASKLTEKIVKITDTIASKLNLVGGSILLSSFLFPIAAPIILTTSLVLTASNTYDLSRQIHKLKTLYKHNVHVSSKQATQEWINLAICGIGTLVSPTFVCTSYKAITSEVKSTTQVTSKVLKTFQKSSYITRSTLDVFRITLNVIDNNFKITLTNVLHLTLDLLCVTGIFYSSIDIKNILKVLSMGAAWAPIYKTLEQIPYCLGQKIMTAVYFFKNHFAVFVDEVTAFLAEKLTPNNLLFAWSTLRRIFTSYQKQTAELDIGDLLWHVVDNTAETESVKYVLRGQRMVKLLECLCKDATNRPINRTLVKYCVEYVLEIANKLSNDHDDCVAELVRRGETRYRLVDEEFCKVYSWKSYKLEKCSMDQYVLWAIDDVSKSPVEFMDEYQQHKSHPEHMFDDEMLVNHTDGDYQSVKGYTFVAPCSVLDFDICLQFAKSINPAHHYNNHEFLQPKPDVSLMINVSAFSYNIVFFGVDLIHGVPKMNICFFQQKRDSSLSVGNHKGLKKIQAAH